MQVISIFLLLIAGLPVSLQHSQNIEIFPFQNISLSWEERVNNLVSLLTLEELTGQMAYGGRVVHAPAIERLGIGPYMWGTECLRGDVEAGPATSFPQAIGLAASFSREVVFNVSRATGLEVRAKNNNYTQHGYYGEHTGLSCWSPVINILRDPRWGRNQETYGEDPFVSGELAKAFVHGLQGDHPRYLLTNAGCKHFAVYSGPENIPTSRLKFDAKVSERDLRMTYLPQFKKCVDAGTYSFMCSYNSVNGVPACANGKLLKEILRDEWGFNGYVISDEGAIEAILYSHNYTNDPVQTVAYSVNAGTNLEDGLPLTPPMFTKITDAVNSGKLTLDVVREATKPLFYTRMRLGEFDPAHMNPYKKLNVTDIVHSPEHTELSILTTLRSFVLLKNKNILPFQSGHRFKRLAIVGPLADNLAAISGDYSPDQDPKYSRTPRQAMADIADVVQYAPGCALSWASCEIYVKEEILKATANADIVVVCLGTGKQEREAHDRKTINLPGKQQQLLEDAVQAANGKPVILLLFNGGPLDITWADASGGVHVIIECFFPGGTVGESLLRMFYNNGIAANPAGRLPMTWPASLNDVPDMVNYSMDGRTYRYSDAQALYPYGYGLSYTNFTYRSLVVRPKVVKADTPLFVDVHIQNEGTLDGEEVIQIYVEWTNHTLPVPRLQLVAFDRVYIPARNGLSKTFQVHQDQLAVWKDQKDRFVILSGKMTVYAGGQQPHQKKKIHSNILQDQFVIQ